MALPLSRASRGHRVSVLRKRALRRGYSVEEELRPQIDGTHGYRRFRDPFKDAMSGCTDYAEIYVGMFSTHSMRRGGDTSLVPQLGSEDVHPTAV